MTAVPSRPEYRLTSRQWRTAIAMRLGMPQEFLRGKYSPATCICHATFAQRSGALARGEAGAHVRKASVRDLRRDRYDRSQSQADIVVENMTPDGVPVLVDFGVTHSLLLSYARAAAQRGELDAEGASKRRSD